MPIRPLRTAPVPRPVPSWEVVWRERRPALLGYATTLLGGDRYAAEDVVQEAGVRFWRRAETLDDLDLVDGWLRTVVRHLVVDRSRRRAARATEVPTEVEREPRAGSPITGPADPADVTVGAAAVRDLLRPLSAAHRRTVLEVYVADRSMVEAAHRMGVPVGTVKSRCHHAIRTLRAALAEDPGMLGRAS